MISLPGRTVGALTALGLTLACQHVATPRSATVLGKGSGASAVELRAAADRPAVSLVHREGDPTGAVALALAHDFGSEASLGLSSILAERLARSGFRDVRAQAHGLGLHLSTLVASPADAARFVRAATAAITTAIAPGQRPPSEQRAPTLRGPAEAAVHACSGELGLEPPNAGSGPMGPPDGSTLESWRGQAASAGTIAFAAVGTRPLLDALANAVATGDKWTNPSAPNDAWPQADSIGGVRSAERRLSVAYRVADAARALEASHELAGPGSVLAARLSALDGAYSVDRIVATSRVRGACLRIDVRADSVETSPLEVARAISVVDDEARRSLASRVGQPRNPRRRGGPPRPPRRRRRRGCLARPHRQQPGGITRRAVSWQGPTRAASAKSERATLALDAARQASSVERRLRLEAGQGELWALVASPCGTASESSDDAGVHEVLARALAKKRSALSGVRLEPWITPDSVGLLAHASRLHPDESPGELARRVGDALGRALVATRIGSSDAAETKSDLLDEIGPAGQRGYFAALDAASGGHPSWLDPRGTWRAVSTTLTSTADARRRVLIGGPLRLAVLANARSDQGEAVGSALERWLRPFRNDAGRCPTGTRGAIAATELNVEVTKPEHVRTYVTYPLTPGGAAREAEWTVHLMNRSGGWLEQTLGSASEARARAALLGGRSASALLIEVVTLEADRARTVDLLRSLVKNLAQGRATEADAEIARRHFEAQRAERALDPRGRIVDLWRGSPLARADLASWRRFHQSLGATKEIVVHARLKD